MRPDEIAGAVRGIAAAIVPLFLTEEVPWAVTGDAALVLATLPADAADVAIITTGRGLRFMASLLELMAEEREPGVLRIDARGVPAVIHGDAVVAGPEGIVRLDERSPLWGHVRSTVVDGQRAFVTPPAWEAVRAAILADGARLASVAPHLKAADRDEARLLAAELGLGAAARRVLLGAMGEGQP